MAASEIMTELSSLERDTLVEVCREVGETVGFDVFGSALGRMKKKPQNKGRKKKKKSNQKPFDMSRWTQHDIALWVSYDGEAYSGFASQEKQSVETVEDRLFEALEKCCLIESRRTCHYSRCGRTDRGVSALRQVVGLRVRTGVSYCEVLNRVLPEDIRVLAWQKVPEGFSARFSAASRTYRYFFRLHNQGGRRRDVEMMRRAAAKFEGDHDFRNFCKMDVEHVKNYHRLILRCEIITEDDVGYIDVTGQAFLWHMVRCLVAVLFLVGDGLEDPTVVDALLDVDTRPARPQYTLASEVPLVLRDCTFDTIDPVATPDVLLRLTDHLEKRLDHAVILAARRRDAVNHLRTLRIRRSDLNKVLHSPQDDGGFDDDLVLWSDALPKVREAARLKLHAQYRPLLDRDGGKTYDERVESLVGRKRERHDANERKRDDSRPHDLDFHRTMRSFG